MGPARDPFRTLGVPYDADAGAVRRAFRRLAHETHPDRGGESPAFQEVHRAYTALSRDLDAERRRWRPAPPPEVPPVAAGGGLDPRVFPTCRVVVGPGSDGRARVSYDLNSRPPGWVPGPECPPGGTCRENVAATATAPAFGVWAVPLDARRFRCVFGPPP